jgi:hypothetical protein
MNEQEKRRHQRFAFNSTGTIKLAQGPETEAHFTEISEGGVRCLFPQAIPLGKTVDLRFTLQLATAKECIASGRVQHYHQEGRSYLLGIEFTRKSLDFATAIDTFIQMQRAK